MYCYIILDIIIINKLVYKINIIENMGIGDWGLGIGPNPQSPIPNPQFKLLNK